MKVIRLTHGAGNGVDTACLMTAINMLIGKGRYGDKNDCVCPVIRAFIISTNDAMPIDLLGNLYGPLVWEILGTKSTPDVEQKRAHRFADWAFRELLPMIGINLEIELIVDARAAAADADARAAAADARAAAAHAAADGGRGAAVRAASAAFNAAAAVRAAAGRAAAAAIWRMCPKIIREVAAIGDKRPVERVITVDELAAALEVK